MHGYKLCSCRGFGPITQRCCNTMVLRWRMWRRRLSLAQSNVQTLGAQRDARSSRAGAGKTLEVRRSEAADARGKAPTPVDMERLFLGSVLDRHRPRVALPPFPKAAPPPAKPSEQRQKVSSLELFHFLCQCSLLVTIALPDCL